MTSQIGGHYSGPSCRHASWSVRKRAGQPEELGPAGHTAARAPHIRERGLGLAPLSAVILTRVLTVSRTGEDKENPQCRKSGPSSKYWKDPFTMYADSATGYPATGQAPSFPPRTLYLQPPHRLPRSLVFFAASQGFPLHIQANMRARVCACVCKVKQTRHIVPYFPHRFTVCHGVLPNPSQTASSSW